MVKYDIGRLIINFINILFINVILGTEQIKKSNKKTPKKKP